MTCEEEKGPVAEDQLVPEILTETAEGDSESTYGRIALAPVRKSEEEIREIINKHQAILKKRLGELDDKYPPASDEFLNSWITI